MGRILCLDTATKVCSVAIAHNGETVDSRILQGEQYSHAENLHTMIRELLRENQWTPDQLDAVAISQGPGSYTGLRIGVSAAKGLCYALQIPMLAICTLRLLCMDKKVQDSGSDRLCPMIDARRNEVYTAVFGGDGNPMTEVEALILDDHNFGELLENHSVAFFGDGSEKFADQLDHPNARFISGVVPNAANMGALAEAFLQRGEHVDVAYFEPFYLKDFIAGKPKKKANS